MRTPSAAARADRFLRRLKLDPAQGYPVDCRALFPYGKSVAVGGQVVGVEDASMGSPDRSRIDFRHDVDFMSESITATARAIQSCENRPTLH